MHIKIYFDEKPLFLCDEISSEIESYVHRDDTVFIDEFSGPAVKSMLHEMQSDKIRAGVLFHKELQELKKAIWRKFALVQAAGGLVRNENKSILFIFRRGKWDLPKGKLDAGESLEECAVREVQEETGLKHLQIEKFILTTYHTYAENGKSVLKESHWYEMSGNGNQMLVPQVQEDIHAVKWVNTEAVNEMLDNSFPSIRDVIERVS